MKKINIEALSELALIVMGALLFTSSVAGMLEFETALKCLIIASLSLAGTYIAAAMIAGIVSCIKNLFAESE